MSEHKRETNQSLGPHVRGLENHELAEEFYDVLENMEYIVDEIRFRRENQPRPADGELPELEDKGQFNQSKTEFHLYLDLL